MAKKLCESCGTAPVAYQGMTRCDQCAATPANRTTQGTEEPVVSLPVDLSTEATSKADQFDSANQVVLLLSLIGAGIITIVGLVPACPPGYFACYDSEKVVNWTLVVLGLASGLVSWWIASFGKMLAAYVRMVSGKS